MGSVKSISKKWLKITGWSLLLLGFFTTVILQMIQYGIQHDPNAEFPEYTGILLTITIIFILTGISLLVIVSLKLK